jgi:hypothetical protein
VVRTGALRKAFASVKGFYLQAEVAGQPVTWLVPHSLSQARAPPFHDEAPAEMLPSVGASSLAPMCYRAHACKQTRGLHCALAYANARHVASQQELLMAAFPGMPSAVGPVLKVIAGQAEQLWKEALVTW